MYGGDLVPDRNRIRHGFELAGFPAPVEEAA